MLKTTTSIINASQIAGVLPVVNGGTGVTTSTGTGSTVLSAAPTLSGDVTLSDNLFVGATTSAGLASNSKITVGGRFRTVAGSVSAPDATATTLFTAPTALAAWLVTVNLDADATIYAATYLINTQGGSATVATLLFKGASIAITVSGYDVKVTQTSGGTATIQYSAIRIA